MATITDATMTELVGPPLAPPVELMRWLMQRHGFPHRYRARAAGLSAEESRAHGFGPELPLILAPNGEIGGAVGGLLPSIMALDGWLKPDATLFPRAGDEAWVRALCAALFPAAVKSFYLHMLPVPDALIPSATAEVPDADAAFIRDGYDQWRALMARGLGLDAFDAAVAEATIARLFDEAAAVLAAQPFLDGAQPGTRDILFAVLASPVILPPQHPARVPPDDRLPAPFRRLVDRCRGHPAGQHVLRLYGAHRADAIR